MKSKNRMFFKNYNLRAIFFAMLFFVTGNFNAQSLFINEFMASNVTSTPEIIDFDAYSDWIEIYNDSTVSINIGGYYLTDNLGNPTKWRISDGTIIASKGFLMFWADGFDSSPSAGSNYYHTNFSLSKDGEELGLFSPEQIMIDSVIFGIQISDVSFGRNPNSGNDWNYFGEPTPNKSNLTNGTLSTEFSNNPNVSLVSGIYSGAQNISVSANFGAEIRYTLDGSMPKSTSLKYETPINITKTTTLRVRVFENDKLPSKIITRAYFIDEPQNLAILSLTAFPETLFDDEIGIYDNQIKSREVPVNVQLFEKNGEKAFEVDAGLRLTGQASFQYPQKPLTIETDDKFGEEVMDYPIFANSITSPVFVDNLSKLRVNYSLSNTTNLEGTGNINADTLLTNNFILNANSPAINSENPTTELDDDGSIADLGAKQFTGVLEPLVINEIHYNPANGDNYEFIEIYNTSTENIITSGIKINGAVEFEFPENSFIRPKEYQIIAKDKYDLLKSEKVELKIFNMLGQEVKTLVNNFEEKGRKSITWNGENNLSQKVSS